jgi:hypothetical protein
MLTEHPTFLRLCGAPDISLLGFTGSRTGMTRPQAHVVMNVLEAIKPSKVFHGDCKGSDKQFDEMAWQCGIWREAYPGMDAKGQSPSRAFCDADVVHPTLPYKERDRLVAQRGTDLLLATPSGPEADLPRSGTWYTIRYAHRIGRTIYVIKPDGDLDLDWLA